MATPADAPPGELLPIAEGFWNLRGSFKLAGLLEIGTQASLVRLRSGAFAMLDAYPLSGAVRDEVFALTRDGRDIEEVLLLHPFHTVYVPALAAQLPGARLWGTARHRAREPGLRWADPLVEGPEAAAHFADDLELLLPPGVELIPADERLHFSSVLALHRATETLHVDDTLGWSALPLIGGLTLHPTLGWVLQPRPGAATELRAWTQALARRCATVDHLCTAHMRAPAPGALRGPALQAAIEGALRRVERTLAAHERRFGTSA